MDRRIYLRAWRSPRSALARRATARTHAAGTTRMASCPQPCLHPPQQLLPAGVAAAPFSLGQPRPFPELRLTRRGGQGWGGSVSQGAMVQHLVCGGAVWVATCLTSRCFYLTLSALSLIPASSRLSLHFLLELKAFFESRFVLPEVPATL